MPCSLRGSAAPGPGRIRDFCHGLLDDSMTVNAILVVDSVSPTDRGPFNNDPIRLIVRCRSNTTDVYIEWATFLGLDDQSVTYRFPPADSRSERWGLSTTNQSTFVDRPIPFLRTLVESERLILRTVPYGESPYTARFNLQGAEFAIRPIADACNWTF